MEKEVVLKVQIDYLLHLPAGYEEDPQKKWPLVLFLHGAGERGSRVEAVKANGPPRMIEQGHDFPAIVVSPQCPADSWWTDHLLPLKALLDQVAADHRVDPERIYITGLSMGGYGALALAADDPERFAGVVAICGGGSPVIARRLRAKPVWLFHGDADRIVPVSQTRDMAAWLERAGNERLKVTIYEGVDHDSWTPAYADAEMWEWLFSQKRD